MARGSVLAVVFVAIAALSAGCSGSERAAPAPSPLSGVDVVDGAIELNGACRRSLDSTVERLDDQIVLSDVTVEGPESDDGCMSVSRVEFDPSLGIEPGMDVVAPEEELRFVFVRDRYVQVDYCGLDTPRCVDFSTDPVPAECSEASLRYATIGFYNGVHPLEVVRCEGDWAVIELDVCRGPSVDEDRDCGVDDVWALFTKAGGGPYWEGTGFEQELFCPNAAEKYGAPGLPEWVCEV